MSAYERHFKMVNLRIENNELRETNYALVRMVHSVLNKLDEADEDSIRLADELKIVLLKTGVVWEEAGEDSPALILHYKRLRI